MKILITGGAGFIGSHLAERLKGDGHEVIVYDRRDDGHWRGSWDYVGDCRTIWDVLPNSKKPEFIYHLAATVGVKRVLEDPKECIENNIESLRAVLGLGIPGIFASTSEVYGRNESELREDSEIIYSSKTRWSYAASKLIGEWLAKQAGWKTVRFFNVVGPRQSTDYGAVLPKFVKQCLDGTPMTIYGDGSQVRTFLDVRDCVQMLDALRDKDFDVVNVGGSHIRSVHQLATDVWMTLRPEDMVIPICEVPYSDAYPEGFEECPRRVPNLEKLNSLLPDRPQTDFKQTIRDLADYLKSKEEVTENVSVCR